MTHRLSRSLNALPFRTTALKALSFRTPLGVRNLLFLSLIAPLAASAQQSRILPPPASFHLPEHQKLIYSVQWHMLNAGTTTVLLTPSNSGEHLHSTADTAGFTNKIFPVHDTFDADFDPHTFCTKSVSRHSEEGSRRLDRKITFDYGSAKSHVDDYDLKTGKRKHIDADIPPCVTDVVTGFFYASSLPLTPGVSETFPVNDGGKTTDVKIEVEGRNRVKVPAGEFETLRVKAEPVSGPLKGKGTLWVWFSDDARHLPVQMKSKLGFANLLFQLQRVEAQPH